MWKINRNMSHLVLKFSNTVLNLANLLTCNFLIPVSSLFSTCSFQFRYCARSKTEDTFARPTFLEINRIVSRPFILTIQRYIIIHCYSHFMLAQTIDNNNEKNVFFPFSFITSDRKRTIEPLSCT